MAKKKKINACWHLYGTLRRYKEAADEIAKPRLLAVVPDGDDPDVFLAIHEVPEFYIEFEKKVEIKTADGKTHLLDRVDISSDLVVEREMSLEIRIAEGDFFLATISLCRETGTPYASFIDPKLRAKKPKQTDSLPSGKPELIPFKKPRP